MAIFVCLYLLFTKLTGLIAEGLHILPHFLRDLGAEMLQGLPDMFDPIPQMVNILHDVYIREVLSLLQCTYDQCSSIQRLQILPLLSHSLSFLKIRNGLLPSARAVLLGCARSCPAPVYAVRILFPRRGGTIMEEFGKDNEERDRVDGEGRYRNRFAEGLLIGLTAVAITMRGCSRFASARNSRLAREGSRRPLANGLDPHFAPAGRPGRPASTGNMSAIQTQYYRRQEGKKVSDGQGVRKGRKIVYSKCFFVIIQSMGCVDSTCHTPALYSNLKTEVKERLRDIIARDDILSLVDLEADENYPSNLELSQSGLRWTTIHFCCRFDSPCCLDYFLKKCFLQNPKQYLFFVNQQTCDGSTSLHLCGVWSSYRCFALLVRYGGLNLSLRDKRQKTAESIMLEYGLKELEKIVSELKGRQGSVTLWNYSLLQQPPNIQQMRKPLYFKQELTRIEDTLRQKMTETVRSNEPSEDEARLRSEKGKLEQEKQELHCELKAKEQQAHKGDKRRKVEQGVEEKEGDKDEQLQLLRKRLKGKEEEIERLKYNIEKLNSERMDQLLVAENQRLDLENQEIKTSLQEMTGKFQHFKKEVLQNRLKYMQAEPSSQGNLFLRDYYRKSRFSETSSKHPDLNTNRKSIEDLKKSCNGDKERLSRLPEEIQERYKRAKEAGKFEDEEFAHCNDSLGGPEYQAKIKPFLAYLEWLRPTEFLNTEFQLFDGIDPNDIKQGQLGVCYCLATIAEYARNPKKIIDIFQYYDLQIGFYVLRFYTNGKPNLIVVDDYFPCSAASKQPLFSKPIGNEIWVLLIEKAWAKIIGSYFAAELMTPDLFMEDLTGSPTYGAWFKDKKDKMKDIITYSSKNYLIVLTTGKRRIQGIVNNHAYSLLKVIEHNGAYIYKLRNPWGRFEWNGCYGEQSTLWTAELKAKCEQVEGDDGVFFLSESEVLQAYEYYSIGLDQISSKYSFVQFTSQAHQDLYFKFTLSQPGMMALRVTQPFKRIIKDKEYTYSPAIFELGRISDNSVTFLSEGNDKCYFGEKSIYATNDIYRQYEKGEYFVRVKMQWTNPEKFNSAVLSVYCDEEVAIERTAQQEGKELWTKMLLSFIQGKRLKDLNEDISYSMEWMKGQMICYSTIRPTAKGNSFKVKWQFNSNELQNCELDLNKTAENSIEYCIDRDCRSRIGTINRLAVGKSCKCGSVTIQSFKN